MQLQSHTCQVVTIQALHTNTKRISVGDSSTSCTAGSEKGILLQPGQTISVETDNSNQYYINSEVNGEGVSYNYSRPWTL